MQAQQTIHWLACNREHQHESFAINLVLTITSSENCCELNVCTLMPVSILQDSTGESVPEKDSSSTFLIPLVCCWNSPSLSSHCVTARGLAAATQMTTREPTVPLCYMTFLSQHSQFTRACNITSLQCWIAHSWARFSALGHIIKNILMIVMLNGCDAKSSIFDVILAVLLLLLLVCVSFTIIGQPRNSVLIRRV